MAKVEKVEKDSSKLDKLPVPVQALIGVASLLGITAVGFGVFFAVDILVSVSLHCFSSSAHFRVSQSRRRRIETQCAAAAPANYILHHAFLK